MEVGQRPPALVEAEAVAGEELVGHREADVMQRDVVDEAAIRPVEERHRGEARRAALGEAPREEAEREARVDYVLDEQDVASGERAVQILDDPYGDGSPTSYLNRAAFATPTSGTYSPLAPFSIVNPSRLQNDLAVTRTFKIGSSQNLQFRWEIFNVINHVNYNAPVTAINSATFGTIQSAGDPRIMQFALKVDF